MMNFHVVGIGAIGTLVAYHLRRVLPWSVSITLMVKNKHQAQELRNRGCLSLDFNDVAFTQKGFDVEAFAPLREAVFGVAGGSRKARTLKGQQSAIFTNGPLPVDEVDVYLHDKPIQSLIVCTKAHSTLNVLRRLQPRIGPETTIVLLHNGMGVYEQAVRELFGNMATRPQFVLGALTLAARLKTLDSLFHTIQLTSGNLFFGIVRDPRKQRNYEKSKFNQAIPYGERALSLSDIGKQERQDGTDEGYNSLRETVAALASMNGLFPVWEPMSAMQVRLRQRLVLASIIHPLSAIMHCRNGSLLGFEPVSRLTKAICDETEALFAKEQSVADGLSHEKSPDDVQNKDYVGTNQHVPKVLQSTILQDNVYNTMQNLSMEHSPMLLDFIKGRETEIEYLNGYIRQLGQAYHVPTPHNNALYDLVKLKEKVTPTNLE